MAERPKVWYVYGVAPADSYFEHAPTGVDDCTVESISDADLAAVTSRLDAAAYAPEAIELGTANMEWLAPRAVAHDRVLTWASDQAPIVPLPMFSLFTSADAVRSMLRTNGPQLRSSLERATAGREYALRLYRLDEELRALASELSPRLALLERAATEASPGQRYLLERKLETERKMELRTIGAQVAREVVDALRPFAADVVEGHLVPRTASGSPESPLVLDAAFLVAPARLGEFRRALTKLIERHASRGFRFDFTGPWPPYHFVQDSTAARARDG